MKRFLKLGLGLTLCASLLAGCGGDNGSDTDSGNGESGAGDSSAASGEIIVITREQGSGTRGAFVELTGVEENDQDNTTEEAIVQNKTDGVMTSVSGDENSIGYISLGSLNDTVKALKIDGAEASSESIKAGDYKISRPFNIAYKEGELSEGGQDFIKFILSKEGQEIVSEDYIAVVDDAPAYEPSDVSGSLTIAGSSSVTPVMEKLAEAYSAINPNLQIAVQQSDSSAGIKAVVDGISEIGMASRELKDSELSEVKGEAIALDGIAVIVNKNNGVDDMTMDSLKGIYTGEILDWEEVK